MQYEFWPLEGGADQLNIATTLSFPSVPIFITIVNNSQ